MFQRMERDNLIDSKSESCMIALAFIYLEIFRGQLAVFVRNWNNHSIRKQPSRPYLVTGRPFTNYYYPTYKGAIECGVPYTEEALNYIQDPVKNFGTIPTLGYITMHYL